MRYKSPHLGLIVFLIFSFSSFAQQPANNLQTKRGKEKLSPLTSTVILISIDGLRNEDFNNPKLTIPTLRSLLHSGSFVQNVESSYPSRSLPAHATMLTGMFPADHGIVSDWKFDEKKGGSSEEKFAASSEIKIETIWQAAKRAGLKTTAINFPFTDATNTDFSSQDLGIASAWVEKNRPQLVMIRFDDLANSLQRFGWGSVETTAALEKIDSTVRKILDSVERSGRTNETTFFIVSSHGFAKIEHEFKPNVILAKKGFITLGAKGKIINWTATTYSSGGTAAVYLKDAKNEGAAKEVEKIFLEIHNQEASPIWRIVSKKEATKLGADPQAAFFLDAAPRFLISEETTGKKLTEKLSPTAGQTTSGYLPSRSEMRGVIIAAGKGIKPKTQIEYARLTDIAPTIARLLGFEFKVSRGHLISELLVQHNKK